MGFHFRPRDSVHICHEFPERHTTNKLGPVAPPPASILYYGVDSLRERVCHG